MTRSRPKVSDKMVTIGGTVREYLRGMLEYSDCVIRRSYRAETGRATTWWVAASLSRIDVVQIHRLVVERWVANQWASVYHSSPTDHSPDFGTEWCELSRCSCCNCVGYHISSNSLCDECVTTNHDGVQQWFDDKGKQHQSPG